MTSDRVAEILGIDGQQAASVRVLVLTGYGLNCEAETDAGFRMLGTTVDRVHVGDLLERGRDALAGYHLLAFIGGFSFGDHIASGRVYANRLRFRLGDRIARHVDDGGFVLGICNGFQTVVGLGLLPGIERERGVLPAQTVSLTSNERLGYRNAWVRLGVDQNSPCAFTQGLETIELPSRHGEGKLTFADDDLRARLEGEHLIPVRYVDGSGAATETWPDNPNGSPGGAAGLCDPSGRIFGLMPHPEAYLYPENHPHFITQRDRSTLPEIGLGLRVLAGGVRAALASFF